ncbi:MAG: hypothetical protein M0Z87_03155 [Actinomycetota bacterium]|nr:hypothetical protein [Actinomycetota bacterium]
MVVGRDLDAVDQLAEELLHDVGAGVADHALDFGADLADELAARNLGDGGTQLGGQLLAMRAELVSASRKFGDAGCAEIGGHRASLEGAQVAVEGGDRLAKLGLGARVLGFEAGPFVGDLGVDLVDALFEDLEVAEGVEQAGADG